MKKKPSDELILETAMKVFVDKGYAGARMEEIAATAGINRALLHYYYRNKQTIFNLIFETCIKEFFEKLIQLLMTPEKLHDKIDRLIDHFFNQFAHYPNLPRFILAEGARNPQQLRSLVEKFGVNPSKVFEDFESIVQKEVKAKKIRTIDAKQLLLHIFGLCAYPFVAKPILKMMLNLSETAFIEVMEKRKKETKIFIRNGIEKP